MASLFSADHCSLCRCLRASLEQNEQNGSASIREKKVEADPIRFSRRRRAESAYMKTGCKKDRIFIGLVRLLRSFE